MNMKKTIYIALAVLVALALFMVFRTPTKVTTQVPIETVQTVPEDKPIVPSGTLADYHSDKYGYTVSYPIEMKITNQDDNEISVYFADDMPSQGFGVRASSTTKSIAEFMASMPGQPDGYTWIVEKTTDISGYPAVIAHQQTAEPSTINDFSSRSVFVKKDNVIFEFRVVGGGNLFNVALFIKNIRFDK